MMRLGWWKSKTDGDRSEESGFLFDTGRSDILDGKFWNQKFRFIGSIFGITENSNENNGTSPLE